MRLLVLLLPAVGCATVQFGPDGSGTSVGNPNKARVTLAVAELPGFDHQEASYPVEAIDLEACAGEDHEWEIGRSLDLLGGELSPVPVGTWCSQTFRPAGNFNLVGLFEDTEYHVEFEEPEVRMDGAWEVEAGASYVIEFGGLYWLQYFTNRLESGDTIDYGPDRHFHDMYRGIFEGAAAVFEDLDEDGVLSDEERDAGMISSGVWRTKQGC